MKLEDLIELLRNPSQAMLFAGGNARIYPSIYMGGPPGQAVRDAQRIWESMVQTMLEELGYE